MLDTPNWLVYNGTAYLKWMIWGYHHFRKYHHFVLVGGLEHFLFFHLLGIIIPTDELIFFRGLQTTNQFPFEWQDIRILSSENIGGTPKSWSVGAKLMPGIRSTRRVSGCRWFQWLQLFGMPIQWSQSNIYIYTHICCNVLGIICYIWYIINGYLSIVYVVSDGCLRYLSMIFMPHSSGGKPRCGAASEFPPFGNQNG